MDVLIHNGCNIHAKDNVSKCNTRNVFGEFKIAGR